MEDGWFLHSVKMKMFFYFMSRNGRAKGGRLVCQVTSKLGFLYHSPCLVVGMCVLDL